MEKTKKLLLVNKGSLQGYFGGYAYDGEIHMVRDVMSARMFEPRERWFEEVDMNNAKEYLIKNGFDYEEYYAEIKYYKA